MAVAVKVLNALEKENKSKVRLWPAERDGRVLSVELDAATVIRAEKPEDVSDLLTQEMADEVAKLFYDHHVADNESW
jgi:hypothetical protein